MSDFSEKLRTLQFSTGRNKGGTRRTRVPRQDRAGVAGVRTEHWDGRVDVTAYAATAEIAPTKE